MGVLPAGTPAPPFRLARADGDTFTEEDLKGRRSLLVFYPFAFSPVCTDQLKLYEDVRRELEEREGRLYGVSCDSIWSQKAFREALGVGSEQLSDFEPKGETCRAFGVLHEGGFPQRALVVTDEEGIVRWSYQAATPGELPGLALLREGLAEAFAADVGA
jgi:peroxiredoxin (alkyl hydroperoxide reductase subunit C)